MEFMKSEARAGPGPAPAGPAWLSAAAHRSFVRHVQLRELSRVCAHQSCTVRPSPLSFASTAAACKFDLRFVPEEQSFEGRQVRDEAQEVPAGEATMRGHADWGWHSSCGAARASTKPGGRYALAPPPRPKTPPAPPHRCRRLCAACLPGARAAAHQRAADVGCRRRQPQARPHAQAQRRGAQGGRLQGGRGGRGGGGLEVECAHTDTAPTLLYCWPNAHGR